MIRWLFRHWRAAQRRTDMSVLWPACLENADGIDAARDAFFYHIINDLAWTTDYTEDELISFVSDLR